jgi:hypothetical protein
VNGQNLAKEFGDQDILDIWEKGLEKKKEDITGFSQYRLPSGVIRVVYTITQRITLGNSYSSLLVFFLSQMSIATSS